MKARKYILGVALIGLIGSGCTNTWDEHYAQNASTVNNTEISIVNESLTDYLAQESSLSNMYQLFNETGMVDQLLAKEQMYTILAVESSIAVGDDPIYRYPLVNLITRVTVALLKRIPVAALVSGEATEIFRFLPLHIKRRCPSSRLEGEIEASEI